MSQETAAAGMTTPVPEQRSGEEEPGTDQGQGELGTSAVTIAILSGAIFSAVAVVMVLCLDAHDDATQPMHTACQSCFKSLERIDRRLDCSGTSNQRLFQRFVQQRYHGSHNA